MQTLTVHTVDAFTSEPFAGNPAAVCILDHPATASWMQQLAREMNLSETAFLAPRRHGWGLRWFTPAVEVGLCGHATLASAHILWETRRAAPDEVLRFYTRSGLLTARRAEWGIELDFPACPVEHAAPPPGLLDALGADAVWIGRGELDWLVELESEEAVRGLAPDHKLLRAVDARGVIVTARSEDKDFDFVSRFFAPGSGIDEDPVTGSAHCCLGPYWGPRLGRTEMRARQVSARGGIVGVVLAGERVRLTGQAVTVMRGELLPAASPGAPES